MDARILSLLGHDRIAEHYGMRTESCADGAAVIALDVDDRHLNGINIVQGGVIFALADVAFAMAANSRGKAIAANCSINFCNPARTGALRAHATEVSLSRKLGTYQVLVEDDEGKPVASFQGLAYRKDA